LQQFLTVPENKLEICFSNDKFYDPILYFCGWHRLTLLENGIMVWEKLNIPPLSKSFPQRMSRLSKKLMWNYSFTNGRYCICAKHSNDSVSSTKIKTTVSPVFQF
jgi:hypothetical protein